MKTGFIDVFYYRFSERPLKIRENNPESFEGPLAFSLKSVLEWTGEN